MSKIFFTIVVFSFLLPNFSLAYIENAPRETTETKKVDTVKIEQKVKNIKVPNFFKKLLSPIDNIRENRAVYFKEKMNSVNSIEKSKIEKLAMDQEILKDDSINYKKVLYQILYYIFSNPIVFYIVSVCIIALLVRIIFNFFI